MNTLTRSIVDLIGLAIVLLFHFSIFAGCSYIVFWRGYSSWWFLLAIFIASSVKMRVNVDAP